MVAAEQIVVDGAESGQMERIIADFSKDHPRHGRVARELLTGKHDWAQLDMVNNEPKLRYLLIPADASKFENPGEGVNWYAFDDDLLKIEGVNPIQALYVLNRDVKTGQVTEKGTKTELKGISVLNGIDILAINFYDMIGSRELIRWGEDRQAYALLLRRSATGMPRRNRICLGLLANAQKNGGKELRPDSELFDIADFDPGSSCNDLEMFPATIISKKFGLIQVVNIRPCLEQYRPRFREKYLLAADYYPYFGE